MILNAVPIFCIFFCLSSLNLVTGQESIDQETFPANQPFSKCFGSEASRVCRNFENDDPIVFGCDKNFLKRKEIFLTSSPWKSSMYMTWIAQIIISEILHYPVTIEHYAGGEHEFYAKTLNSKLNTVEYAWKGLETAFDDMTCDANGIRKSRGIPDEVKDNVECIVTEDKPLVPISCYPCTHAMLDVWSETQTEAVQKYVYTDRVAEISSSVGYEGGVALYMPKTAIEKVKGVESFLGFRDPEIAGKFGQLLTLGQYCYKVFLGQIPDDPPDELNENGRRRRCAVEDQAANTCNVGSYVEGAPADDSFCELFYLFAGPASENKGVAFSKESCRDAKPGNPTDNIHIMCSLFTVTVREIFKYLSPLGAEIASTRFIGKNPLYSGYFDTQYKTDDPTTKIGTFGVKGCNWKSPTNPLGGRWSHDYLEIENSNMDGMLLKSVDYGEYILDLHDAASRRASVDNIFQPFLLMLERPNPQFQRYKYQSNVRRPYTYNKKDADLVSGGKAFELAEVQMAPNTEACQSRRETYFDGICEAENDKFAQGLASTPSRNLHTCSNFTDNSVNPVCAPEYDHCGFKKYKPVKVFSSKLEKYSPEVYYFLKNFKLSLDDIEEMLGMAGYSTNYTGARDQNVAQRHVVCDWVKANQNKWERWLPSSVSPSGTDTVRCLGEINPVFSGGKYVPGVMCSGHGKCVADSSNGKANAYAGVCVCEEAYTGTDDCSVLREGDDINISGDNQVVLVMFSINGLCFIFVTIVWVFIYPNRNEPVIFYSSYNYVKFITYASQLGYAHLYFWVGKPTATTCVVRPLLIIFSFLLFFGTIFARIYRTSLVLWGKTPPPKIVTDGVYVWSILKKVFMPEILICALWMIVSTPKVEIGRPPNLLHLQYAYCSYGNVGTNMLAIAIAYVVLISTWAFTLLITIYKSGEDPLYHNDTFLMTKGLAIVWISGALGFAGSMILGEFPTYMIYRFILISVVTSVCTTSGLFVLIYPKYRSIYLNPDENIIFPGKFYQQQVMENNKMRKIFPTEDETSIDPRVLRKNKELLKENLQLIESMKDSSKELKEVDAALKEYEEARKKRMDMINATADESANILDDVPSRDGDESENSEERNDENANEELDDDDSDDGEGFKIPRYNIVPRLKAVVEATVTEASEHLSRMDEAKMSEAAKSKLLDEKRRKVNLALDQIHLQKKRRRKLEVASHNALPPLDNILRYHNLLQYTRLFRKLKMTTAKLIQLQPNEIKRLGMRLGHQRKLEVAIKNLVGTAPPPIPTPTATPAPSVVSEIVEDINEMSAAAVLARFELEELSEKFIDFGCEGSADLLLMSVEDLNELGLNEEQIDIFQDLKDWMEEQYKKIEIERQRKLMEVPEVDDEDSVSDTSMKDEDEKLENGENERTNGDPSNVPIVQTDTLDGVDRHDEEDEADDADKPNEDHIEVEVKVES